MYMKSKEELSSEEMDTVKRSRTPTVVSTANGDAHPRGGTSAITRCTPSSPLSLSPLPPPPPPPGVYLKCAPCCESPMEMDPSGQHSSGAAQRRKQRRMRSWWRHEQVSIAAAVATALHHSAQRGGECCTTVATTRST